MKKDLFKLSLFIFTVLLALQACKKNTVIDTPTPVLSPAVGEYVLSEGGFGGNNTKLAYYVNSTAAVTGDFFVQQNPTMASGLGDVGNDMIIYGSKLYIIMNNSGRVTVLNASNATFVKNISFLSGGVNKLPRYAAAARGKVYVTSTDGTVSAIDTTSLTIVKTITVGANPEGIAASADYLYIANSGGYNPAPDSTVSLVDLNTETEIKKIKVGVNPYRVAINGAGNVYVSAYGNYTTIPASIFVINGTTNTNGTNLGSSFQYSNVRIFNNLAYFYNNYGGVGNCKLYNTATGTVVRNEFITDGTSITTPYGLSIDEQNSDVYIADAGNFVSAGKVYCFNSAGVLKFSFSVAPGVNPNNVLFKR